MKRRAPLGSKDDGRGLAKKRGSRWREKVAAVRLEGRWGGRVRRRFGYRVLRESETHMLVWTDSSNSAGDFSRNPPSGIGLCRRGHGRDHQHECHPLGMVGQLKNLTVAAFQTPTDHLAPANFPSTASRTFFIPSSPRPLSNASTWLPFPPLHSSLRRWTRGSRLALDRLTRATWCDGRNALASEWPRPGPTP